MWRVVVLLFAADLVLVSGDFWWGWLATRKRSYRFSAANAFLAILAAFTSVDGTWLWLVIALLVASVGWSVAVDYRSRARRDCFVQIRVRKQLAKTLTVAARKRHTSSKRLLACMIRLGLEVCKETEEGGMLLLRDKEGERIIKL